MRVARTGPATDGQMRRLVRRRNGVRARPLDRQCRPDRGDRADARGAVAGERPADVGEDGGQTVVPGSSMRSPLVRKGVMRPSGVLGGERRLVEV